MLLIGNKVYTDRKHKNRENVKQEQRSNTNMN